MEAQAAIDIKPENIPAYWALSDAYRILGDYDAAFEQCKKSISFIKEGMNLKGGQNIEEAQKKWLGIVRTNITQVPPSPPPKSGIHTTKMRRLEMRSMAGAPSRSRAR